jgi:predicted acyltransferase
MSNSPEKKQERLLSLDTLRGFDMLWISGGEYLVMSLSALTGWPLFKWAATQMEHVEWEGFHFYDMIFPLFLFIAGVSMPFSILKRKQRGESMRIIYFHLFKRLFLLILLGLIYQRLLEFDFEHQRYASVLARIGIAWFLAAVIVLNTSVRGQIYWFVGILIGYYAIMKYIPVPVLEPESLHRRVTLPHSSTRNCCPEVCVAIPMEITKGSCPHFSHLHCDSGYLCGSPAD